MRSDPHLTLASYMRSARESDQFSGDSDALFKLRLGYFGEIGGLLAAEKKILRDDLTNIEQALAREELGDALWYLTGIAEVGGVEPATLAESCVSTLRADFSECQKNESIEISFAQIDGLVATQPPASSNDKTALLRELASTAGSLAEDGSDQVTFRQHPRLNDRLGRCLALLARTAAAFQLTLRDIAIFNLEKTKSRWPGEAPEYHPLFDEGSNVDEQLPRDLRFAFIERTQLGGKPYVVIKINGVQVGNILTDNRTKADGYRYHDVFHIAYAAHLGWSPVIRTLLNVRRLSNHSINENQDGARAKIIEEGVSTWIFNHAEPRAFFAGTKRGKLEYSLLKQVRSMVDGYEVEACPLWQWERAILGGFEMFRLLVKHSGGFIRMNLYDRSVTFATLSSEP